MKNTLAFLFAVLCLNVVVFGQTRELPNVTVTSLEGDKIETGTFANEDGPIIISFWATWCKPCVLELNTVAEDYEDLVDETGVKLIAISIDDARNSHKVAPFVAGKGWEYEVFIDENADFKRAMNVGNVPHTFVLNSDGEIVWQHNSYTPGDEEDLYEVVEAVSEGKTIPGHDGEH